MEAPTIEAARAAKLKALGLLKNSPAVVGVGIARLARGYCVKVNVNQKVGKARFLPQTIDGVPVRVEVVGAIRKR